MKFSFRQILASATGAVIAALIASSFGVTGTIVGVAIGSMAATLGTAFVSQSIERGQKAVKQAAVRVPEGPTANLLRRMGGTGAAGGATSSATSLATSSIEGGPTVPEPTEVVGTVGEEKTETGPAVAPGDAAARTEVPGVDVVEGEGAGAAGAAGPDRPEAATVPLRRADVLEGAGVVGVSGSTGVAAAAGADGAVGRRRFTLKAFAVTAAIVFVLALGLVTAVELIADKPLASIFGSTGSGPTLKNIFMPGPPATSTSTTSTTTPAVSTSTTSTSTTSTTTTTTTTTTAPTGATTTTTPGPATTTTTGNLSSTTTTSPRSGTTTTTTAAS